MTEEKMGGRIAMALGFVTALVFLMGGVTAAGGSPPPAEVLFGCLGIVSAFTVVALCIGFYNIGKGDR